MKKIVILLFMGVFLLPVVKAETTDTTKTETEAGLTPDNPFYFIEKTIEKLDLTFTFDDAKKTDKLLKYAKERLAEAKIMTEEEKIKYIEDLVLEYANNLDEASDNLIELTEEESEELEAKLDEAISQSDELSEKLDFDLAQKLEERKGAAYIKFSILKDALLNQEKETIIKKANDAGFGLGELSKIAIGANLLDQSLEVTLDGVIEAGSIDAYFNEFGINENDLINKGIEYKQAILHDRLLLALENANEIVINRIKTQIEESLDIQAFQSIREEYIEEREEILAEYNVNDFYDLDEETRIEVINELRVIKEEARNEVISLFEVRKLQFMDALRDIISDHSEENKDILNDTLAGDIQEDIRQRIQEGINKITTDNQ